MAPDWLPDIDPLGIDPLDMEPLDIDPDAACFFAGCFMCTWPFDIAPEDIDPEDMAPCDIEPEFVAPADIEPELMAPPELAPDWLLDIEPDDIEPLFWLCATAAVAAATQRTRPSPAFLAWRNIKPSRKSAASSRRSCIRGAHAKGYRAERRAAGRGSSRLAYSHAAKRQRQNPRTAEAFLTERLGGWAHEETEWTP